MYRSFHTLVSTSHVRPKQQLPIRNRLSCRQSARMNESLDDAAVAASSNNNYHRGNEYCRRLLSRNTLLLDSDSDRRSRYNRLHATNHVCWRHRWQARFSADRGPKIKLYIHFQRRWISMTRIWQLSLLNLCPLINLPDLDATCD